VRLTFDQVGAPAGSGRNQEKSGRNQEEMDKRGGAAGDARKSQTKSPGQRPGL
jgi:hypothetical protein